MRLNLLVNNPDDVIGGYLNVDPLRDSNDTIKLPLDKLESQLDFGEAEEIIVNDTLRYFPDWKKILIYWARFVKIGGLLVVKFYELEETAYAFAEKRLTSDEARSILYGKAGEIRSGCTIEEVISVLKELGFRITGKKFLNLEAVVSAERQ